MSSLVPQLVTIPEAERILLLRRHKGLLQRVAERCRVHPSLVSRVFHGKTRSARVEKELEKALSRLSVGAARAGRPKSPGIRFTTPVDRSRELHWLADHRKEYTGRWVALDGYRLLASSDNPKEVFAAARKAGVPHPLFHWVDPPDAPPFGGW